MDIQQFITRVIELGSEAAGRDYGGRNDARGRARLAGALAGFAACQDGTPAEIAALLERERRRTHELLIAEDAGGSDDYWYQRCKEAEIEWVANCASCVLAAAGEPTIVNPTARAMITTGRILAQYDLQPSTSGG